MTTLVKPFTHLGGQNRASLFEAQTVSVDFNGTDEKMASAAAAAPLGIANEWTKAIWWKPGVGLATGYIVELDPVGGGPTEDRIVMYYNSPNFEVYVYETTAGTLFKRYNWINLHTEDVWNFIVITWDGTNLVLYKDGTEITPSDKITDNAGTQAERARVVRIKATTAFGYTSGRVHSVGLWDRPLSSSEVGALYNSGNGSAVDWSNYHGDYVSSGNLQHWWRLGHDSTDMGADSGKGAAIDVDVDSENISADDIVTDAP